MAKNEQLNSIAWCKILNVGFIKQIMVGEELFSSLFNLVNYQLLFSNLVPLDPGLKLSFFI